MNGLATEQACTALNLFDAIWKDILWTQELLNSGHQIPRLKSILSPGIYWHANAYGVKCPRKASACFNCTARRLGYGSIRAIQSLVIEPSTLLAPVMPENRTVRVTALIIPTNSFAMPQVRRLASFFSVFQKHAIHLAPPQCEDTPRMSCFLLAPTAARISNKLIYPNYLGLSRSVKGVIYRTQNGAVWMTIFITV